MREIRSLLAACALVLSTSAQAATLSLEEALQRVEAGNPQLEAAVASLDAARADPGRALSAYLPQASASGSYTRNSTPASIAFPDFAAGFQVSTTPDGEQTLVPAKIDQLDVQKEDQLQARFQVQQGILLPSAIPAYGAAKAGANAARWGTEAARRQVLFGTAELYLGCVAMQRAVAVNEAHLELLRDHLASTRAAYDAGAQPQLAVTRAALDLKDAELQLNRAQRDLSIAKAQLAAMMGASDLDFEVQAPPDLQRLLDGSDPLIVGATTAPADLPMVLSAEHQLDAARRQHTSQVLGWLPSVVGSFAYNHTNAAGFAGQNGTWAATVSVNVPIFDGGLRVKDIEQAAARKREAEARLRQERLAAETALIEAQAQQEAAVQALSTARDRVELARANWEALQVAFGAGAATPLEVADAATNLRQAELGALSEAIAVVSTGLDVELASGGERPGVPR